MLAAGLLDQRIIIQSRVDGKDAMGGIIVTWNDLVETWARAEQLRGAEFFASVQVQAKLWTKFRLRYRPGIREKMRVKHLVELDASGPAKYYDIEAVIIVGRRDELQLMCVERQADGFQT